MENSWRNYISRYNIICLLGGILSYLINEQLKNITNNIIIHYYLNDFLATILLLSFSNLLLQTKGKGIYSLKSIYLFTFLVGIEWEYIAPLYVKNSVSDSKDIIAYFLGSTLYYIVCLFINKVRIIRAALRIYNGVENVPNKELGLNK